MKIQYVSDAQKELPDVLAVAVGSPPFEDPYTRALNKTLGEVPKKLTADHDFVGRRGQVLVTPASGKLAKRFVLFLGVGSKKEQTPAQLRDLAARAVKRTRRLHGRSLTLVLPTQNPKNLLPVLRTAALGATLGTYEFTRYKTQHKRRVLDSISLSVERDPNGKKRVVTGAMLRNAKTAIDHGHIVGRAVCQARDWVNEPPGAMTPSMLADNARRLAKEQGLTIKVLGQKECEKLGMGMFLAVGRGSDEEPKFIHLTYHPPKKSAKRVCIIGKGVTFDSGGYSLKPSAGMEDMKTDMAGAAAVISAIGALAEIGCKYEVHALAACCENLVSGRAYKLGDVLNAFDGTTVEINNTDAEGRLTLGDAIGYARKVVKADEIFDFATLTGACMVALGPYTAGVFSETPEQRDAYLDAAKRAGEHHWRLPLTRKLREQLKSNIADMRNTGDRMGGATTAALFLRHFAGDAAWVHVDMAGPASAARNQSAAIPKGGTGFAVASIVEYLAPE
jgi:leucyl aminopeptidase